MNYSFKTIALLSFCLLQAVMFSQASQYFKTMDFGGEEEGYVYVLSNGDFVAIGQTDQGSNNGDMLVSRLDNAFNVTYAISIGDASQEKMKDLLEMDNGDILLTGARDNAYKPILMRVPVMGGNIDMYDYGGGTYQDRMHSLHRFASTGNILNYGFLQSSLPSNTKNKPTFIEFDASLNLLSNQFFNHQSHPSDNAGERYVYDVIENPGGDYLVLGVGTESNGSGYIPNMTPRIFNFDASSNMQSIVVMDSIQRYTKYAKMIRSDDGGIIMVGYMRTGVMMAGVENNLCFQKLDTSFNVVWSKGLSLSGNEELTDIVSVGNDEYIISGYLSNSVLGGEDACLIKIDGNGNVKWSYAYGGASDERGLKLDYISSQLYFSGHTASFSQNNDHDIFLMASDSSGLLLDTLCFEEITLPFQNHTTTTSIITPYTSLSFNPPISANVNTQTLTTSIQDNCLLCSFGMLQPQSQNICFRDTVWFSVDPLWSDSIYWDFGDSDFSINDSTPWHIYQDAGTYNIMVSIHNDSLGCSDSSGFALEVYPLPEPYAGEDTCICLGDSTQIGAADNPFWTYLWTPTGSVISDPVIYPLVEDTFIVNVADTNNCIGADTLFICVNPLPDIEALSDTVIILGNSADLSAIGGSTYLWESSVSIDCPDCPQIQVVPDTTTYFYLSGLDTNGCAGNDTLLVVVEYEDTVLVPNLFSPNGDGRNDILYVRTFGRFKDIDFKLYNRWGKLVFHTKDENIGWDGYYNDVLQPVDVYVYHLVANTLDGQMFEQKGDITLLR